jgi:hypothetical protein
MSDFDHLIAGIETEAKAEGPEAVAELRAFEERMTRPARPEQHSSVVPSPHKLYEQAGGDAAKYRALMIEHGHLVPIRRPDGCESCKALVALIREAAPFVEAVAVMADDKGPALGWLADAASVLSPNLPPEGDSAA